jgi:hypothetical protein
MWMLAGVLEGWDDPAVLDRGNRAIMLRVTINTLSAAASSFLNRVTVAGTGVS